MNKNKAKPTKTSTRLGKVSKAKTKKAIYLRKKPKTTIQILRDSKNDKRDP